MNYCLFVLNVFLDEIIFVFTFNIIINKLIFNNIIFINFYYKFIAVNIFESFKSSIFYTIFPIS